MIIGLTGTYCSGKNHISTLLEERGLPVLDVDKLGHKAIDLEKDKIIALFGGSLESSLNLDRRLIGKIVYGNPEKLAALEAIVHPVANRLTEEWVQAQKGHCVINAALLHRTSLIEKISQIILVKAPFFTRLIRGRRRDSHSWSEAWKRIASQKDFYTQYLSLNAEIYIVENPGLSLSKSRNEKLVCQVDQFVERIK